MNNTCDKSLETWIWDAACSIRGAQEAPKFKDFILPLIFTKRLCDVFDDELNPIAKEVGSRAKAFKLVAFRTPIQARQRDFTGQTISTLGIDPDGGVIVEIAAYEVCEVELLWS